MRAKRKTARKGAKRETVTARARGRGRWRERQREAKIFVYIRALFCKYTAAKRRNETPRPDTVSA